MSAILGRYVIGQILGPFGLFALIFTGVIWLTQSLRVIETVVNNGQSAVVFLEFTALLLPKVMAAVLPISAFAATIWAINRLLLESELVVMMASGMSRLALARPVAIFAGGVTAAMFVVTLYLMPAASRETRDRLSELRADIASALIREGQFIHAGDGLTVYVRETARDGQMAGLFVQDSRDPNHEITYTAARAALVRTDDGPRLVMFDGVAQDSDRETGKLTLLDFDKLVYDLSQFTDDPDADRTRKPSEYNFWDLVAPSEEILARGDVGKYVSEGHEQLAAPLYALALPLIGLAALIGPGFRRRGYMARITLAVAAGGVVRLLGFAAKSATAGAAGLWPTFYAPPLLGIALALMILWRGWPRWRPAGRAAPPAAGAAS